jgi:tetratricopeptide (TPR) repeat protein
VVALLVVALAFQPAPAMLRSLFEQELARVTTLYGPAGKPTALAAHDLGLFLARDGDRPAARAALAHAVAASEAALGPSAHQTLVCIADLASVSEPADADPLWRRAAASPDPALSARAFGARGDLREQAGDRKGAVRFYRLALAREEIASAGVGDRLAARLNTLALLLDAREALPMTERALELATRSGGRRVETASIQINLSTRLLALGRRAPALHHATEAVSIFEEILGPEHPRTLSAEDYLRRLNGVNGSGSR